MADNEKLTCPICGEPTRVWYGNARKDRLCGKHADMLKAEEIFLDQHGRWRETATKNVLTQAKEKTVATVPHEEPQKHNPFWIPPQPTKHFEQCKDCNKYHEVGVECECKKELTSKGFTEESSQGETTKIVIINEENKSRCITCGKKTDGLLFCGICYKKYHNKELLFRIKGCSSVELLDEDYEGKFTCKDGHVVKSKSEREIDNYLFEKGIPHAYEKELPYGKTEKETLHPDFYLPHYLGKDKHVWIEHWGYDDNNRDYTKTKKFKMPIYEKLGITLICTYEKNDTGDIDATLDRKLNKNNIDENTINYK